uniref:ATP synthase F0 subunit 8 n=1 Tax=Hickmania troglodytes TaxID=489260 RepID=H2E3L7_9ARAC|nr:ATP synthase F0 subunit 8 [Hickmania troglodytes]
MPQLSPLFWMFYFVFFLIMIFNYCVFYFIKLVFCMFEFSLIYSFNLEWFW